MNTKQLLVQYPHYLIFGFLHYFFSFVGQTFFVGLFVTGICLEKGWDTSTFASIYSVVTLSAAFTLPQVGKLLDRLAVRHVSMATSVVMIFGTIVISTHNNWWLLALGIFCVRLGGQGVLTLTGSTSIGRFFTEGRGKALSFSMLGICAAEIIIPPLATALILSQGYRNVWLLTAMLLGLIFLPAVVLLIKRNDSFQRAEAVSKEQNDQGQSSWTRGQVLADRRFQYIIPIVLFLPFFFTGFVFNQSDIGNARGFSPAVMAWGLSTYGLTRAICILFAGGVVDRFGPARLIVFVLLPAILGIGLFLSINASFAVPLTFGLMAVSGGIITVTLPTLWADRYGPQYLGSIKSTVKLLEVLSSAAAPVVFSFGLSKLGLTPLLLLMITYGGICVLLAWLERRLKV